MLALHLIGKMPRNNSLGLAVAQHSLHKVELGNPVVRRVVCDHSVRNLYCLVCHGARLLCRPVAATPEAAYRREIKTHPVKG
jgi:hypothetical protein